ncbi:F-box protein SKIP24 isoform X2 [Physcomitrium patens]|uniref:F-box protein SKIP24 isoform X2 n=1 Tax=Physcomitrium patens TaxID=3218 RepID=UPI000D176A80|nr:F-box protein SKIP24-like isoform X2 [Physcomitrium patens]XP_024403254.1 F-box protein SKIP24-like isoform X2 [Physcomitrium patens]|eukprot:XP_024403253.1 F-box protein SKIP24-like isoform X2 [Physcomitrella patens]
MPRCCKFSMGCLPDELWTKILGLGIEKEVLDYRDLCSLAFVCRRIKKISYFDCIWRPLWERDQAKLSVGSSSRNLVVEPGMARKENDAKAFRDLYRIRFEKVRAAIMAAHRRRVLRVESQVAVLQKEAQQYQLDIQVERRKLVATVAELKSFEVARRSAIAIQVWQPQAVRARQQEVLEQQSVNVGARQQSLQMEINVCRERVQQFEKSLQAKKSAIEKCKKELDSLTFNPSRKLHDSSNTDERPGRKAAPVLVKRGPEKDRRYYSTSQPPEGHFAS